MAVPLLAEIVYIWQLSCTLSSLCSGCSSSSCSCCCSCCTRTNTNTTTTTVVDVKNGARRLYNVTGGTAVPLLAQILPSRHVGGWMPPAQSPLSDYEIPLDEKWEFPRERYV